MVHRSPRPAVSAESIAADAAEFRTPEFRQALVAAVALVAHADGALAPVERSRLLSLMEENSALSAFSRDEIIDDLALHEANYRLDPELAAEMARETLLAIAGRARLCSAVVRVCRAIIPADGVIHPAEHRALADIRALLGLSARPVVFGAYAGSGFVTSPTERGSAD